MAPPFGLWLPLGCERAVREENPYTNAEQRFTGGYTTQRNTVFSLFLTAAVAVLAGPALAHTGEGLAGGLLSGLRAGIAVGGAVLLGALDEHPFGTLPVSIYAGICFATLLLAVAITAFVRMSFDRWGEAKWLTITWRTGASWCAAMLLLALAFELRPPV